MANTIPFDRAKDYYDQTRGLPEPMATQGLPVLLDQLGSRACVLEVGTGTGRIGIPLLERGINLIGCDLSLKMMQRQQAKRAATRLAQADAVYLPFGAQEFDALLTVHVLHLVGAWRVALREFRRVLKPGGVYINTWNWHAEDSVHTRVRGYWRKRVEAHGGVWRRPGIQKREEVVDEAQTWGAVVETIEAARFSTPLAPSQVLDGLDQRIFSDTWDMPAEIYEPTVRETRAWAEAEFGDVTQPLAEEGRFILDVIRF